MTRSSGIPRQRGLDGVTRIVSSRSRAVTVKRPTVTKGSLDEETTTITERTEYMWLFEPRENVAERLTGERVEGSLGALISADQAVDIQHNDRITYGGVEYEVDAVVGHPEDGDSDGTRSTDTDLWIVTFTRRQ